MLRKLVGPRLLQTLNPQPEGVFSTHLNPKPQTPNPKPYTPVPSTSFLSDRDHEASALLEHLGVEKPQKLQPFRALGGIEGGGEGRDAVHSGGPRLCESERSMGAFRVSV